MENKAIVVRTAKAWLTDFDKAKAEIAKNTNIDELKDIRARAEAGRHWAKQAKIGLHSQNMIAAIKVRSERQAGRLLTAMEGKGSHGGRRSSCTVQLEDLGITKHQSARWQIEGKIPDTLYEEYEQKCLNLDCQEELTSSHVMKLNTPHVSQNTGEHEWYTPQPIIDAARAVLGEIDCDPASTAKANKRIKAKKFYTKERTGIGKVWGKRVWMNPPYSEPIVKHFCDTFCHRYQSGEIEEGIVLINNITETGIGQRLLRLCSAVCFHEGRVKFLDADDKPGAPLQGQMSIYCGPKAVRFLDYFTEFGACLRRDK